MKRRRDHRHNAVPLPPVKRIKELLRYDEETGLLHWRVSRGGRPEGAVAGHRWSDGRRVVRIDGVLYYAARCVWKLKTGRDPQGILDHFDRDNGNDRWLNLRDITQRENVINQSLRKDNTSGFRGVHFSKRRNRWVAKIRWRGKDIHLGRYDTPELAAAAYQQGSLTYHTSRWFAFGGDFR